MSQILTITKEQMPSKLYSLGFRIPTYKDYCDARKRYPNDRQENNRVPYSLEEMLLAMCMEEINEKKITREPADIIEQLSPFPIADRQFAVRVFISVIYTSREEAEQARDLGEEASQTYQQEYTLLKQYLPTKKYSITVRTPNSGVQMEVDRRFTSASNIGCSLEEMLFAYCLATQDGVTVQQSTNIISVLNDWAIADVQFSTAWFVNLFCINDQGSVSANELGKSMRASITGSSPSSSTKKSTTNPV